MIKVIGIVGNALQSSGQLRLLKHIARLVVVAVALKDAMRLGKLRQLGIAKGASFIVVEHKTIARQLDSRLHHLLQRQFAPMLLRVNQSSDRAWYSD